MEARKPEAQPMVALSPSPTGSGGKGPQNGLTPEAVIERYRKAKEKRSQWETHWQECYDYALPQRADLFQAHEPGAKRTDKVFDATAPDSVDQLAASLLGELTPPWARWFGLTLGPEAPPDVQKELADQVEKSGEILQGHFDRSNFSVEMHQCYLDLVVSGTACLLFEEAPIGENSAFRFTAIPLSEVVMAEGAGGRLDHSFRRSEMTIAQIKDRFPKATLPQELTDRSDRDPDMPIPVIEAVVPDNGAFLYMALIEDRNGLASKPVVLKQGRFQSSPFLNFRWQKAPSEIYGRSPVMKVLPDIKTLNKVVELMLKNASIAVTGIWQADDDGVLNPATISLTPGSIIPKAVGSAGLQPLDSPGRMDLSEKLIEQLRASVRSSLLTDKLSQPDQPSMTATEVLQRSADMARLLGATFGRLQAELLTPMIGRAVQILIRRGEIPDLVVDGRVIDYDYRSPLARYQASEDAQRAMTWVQSLSALGPMAIQQIDSVEAVKYFAKAYGVPQSLLRKQPDVSGLAEMMKGLGEGGADLSQLAEQLLPQLQPLLHQMGIDPAALIGALQQPAAQGLSDAPPDLAALMAAAKPEAVTP